MLKSPSRINEIRNPDGIFINTTYFREEAIHFQKHGYYCNEPMYSPAWIEYWQEQLKRCIEGYSVGGVYITGDHYNYLNFSRIMKTQVIKGNVAKKILEFPDFWDGDYNYFHVKDIARYGTTEEKLKELQLTVSIKPQFLNGGYHLIVGKGRRKGYSFKNGAVAANIYNTQRNATVVIGAYLSEYLYPEGTMSMATNYLNFYNEHTGWIKAREYKNTEDYRRASYKKEVKEGVFIESGYMSSIIATSFKDNPDAARGKDGTLILMEEAGKFPNLEASYMATEATTRSGGFITGQIIVFGTGGDMESGTVDFAKMFYEPELYMLLPFVNIWDDQAEQTNCGFFHPMYINNDGYYDKEGNSDIIKAKSDESKERDRLRKLAGGIHVIQKRVQEYPFSPSEAFLTVSTNDFPIVELRNRLNKIRTENLHVKLGQPGELYRNEEGKVKFKPDLEDKLTPNWFRIPNDNKEGAVVIYEYPIADAPKGLYKIGYDPYQQDIGTSMASIYVKKGHHRYSGTNDIIVASWTGRLKDADSCHRIFEMLCELYNAEGMHENMVRDVITYFKRRNKLHLLAAQPDKVISAAIKDSKVARIWGCHMTLDLKKMGANYTKQWLLKERDVDEQGNVLTNIDFINDPGFIEELILWNLKGNYDRVSAWFMVMIQDQEDDLDKVYDNKQLTGNLEDLKTLHLDLYKN